MVLFSGSVQRMEELIRNSKKVRRGAKLEEAEIDGSWLTTCATISGRCRDDKDLGVSRDQYELPPGVNPFAGGFFEHRERTIRRRMECHSSLRQFYQYESHYSSAAEYWMSLSVAATALSGDALRAEGTQGIEDATRYDVWAMLAVRYGLLLSATGFGW
jgi:hypothetical protein